ncbi:hypothetical protein SLE2022_009720 [Rubroshorea leprosula]
MFPSSSSAAITLCIFALLFNGGCTLDLPKNVTVRAIFVFGDSIVDPGNNNKLNNTIAKCNFPPYGRDFPGGKPTGRFSNGKLATDFAAELLGVKELLPAYLDPTLQLQDLLTGVSFASGGAGYDPLTSRLASVYSMPDQLDFFKEYKEKIKSVLGEEQVASFLSKSLFVVCCGVNDISTSYRIRRAEYDIDSYTDIIVSSASKFFQELYEAGARRVAVLGLPPVGCVPSQRTLFGGITRGCADDENHWALLYNSKLSAQIGPLKNSLPDLKIAYVDLYNPLLNIIQNPHKYGFEVENVSCCGTGRIEVTVLCNPATNTLSCPDASKYVFWDSYHPTEKAYKILTPILINQNAKELL